MKHYMSSVMTPLLSAHIPKCGVKTELWTLIFCAHKISPRGQGLSFYAHKCGRKKQGNNSDMTPQCGH